MTRKDNKIAYWSATRKANELYLDELLHPAQKGITSKDRAAYLKEALREIRPTTTEWLATVRNYAQYSNEGGQFASVR